MIDEIDRKLINELQGNGRATYATLASKLGISKSTVSRKIDYLVKNHILTIIGVADMVKIGMRVSALIALEVEPDKIDDLCKKLVNNPNIPLLIASFGRYDVFLLTHFASAELLTRFIKKELSQIPGIKDVETFFVNETFKAGFCIFQKDENNR